MPRRHVRSRRRSVGSPARRRPDPDDVSAARSASIARLESTGSARASQRRTTLVVARERRAAGQLHAPSWSGAGGDAAWPRSAAHCEPDRISRRPRVGITSRGRRDRRSPATVDRAAARGSRLMPARRAMVRRLPPPLGPRSASQRSLPSSSRRGRSATARHGRSHRAARPSRSSSARRTIRQLIGSADPDRIPATPRRRRSRAAPPPTPHSPRPRGRVLKQLGTAAEAWIADRRRLRDADALVTVRQIDPRRSRVHAARRATGARRCSSVASGARSPAGGDAAWRARRTRAARPAPPIVPSDRSADGDTAIDVGR